GAATADVPRALTAATTTPAVTAPDTTRFNECDGTSPLSPLRLGHLSGASRVVRSGALTRARVANETARHHMLITRCQRGPAAKPAQLPDQLSRRRPDGAVHRRRLTTAKSRTGYETPATSSTAGAGCFSAVASNNPLACDDRSLMAQLTQR